MQLPHEDKRTVGPHIDHPTHAWPGIRVFPGRLYVITCVSNPARFRKRYELYRQFEKHMHESGVTLITVEVATGEREFEVTDAKNPHHLQLTSHHMQEVWLKENMLNLGIQHLSRLYPKWEYVAWIDADVHFSRNDWAQEVLHQLQSYTVVQPWTHAYDLDPNDRIMETHQSFGFSLVDMGVDQWDQQFGDGKYEPGDAYRKRDNVTGAFWHPGYAWAARREFFTATGGLFEVSGLGAGDFIMALGMIGRIEKSYHGFVSDGFKRACAIWQDRAKKIYRNVGYCDGTIWHKFHGHKAERRYQSRWSYLIAGFNPSLHQYWIDNMAKFNPDVDLIRDHQGLLQIPEEKVDLRDGFRRYFRQRNEDFSFFS